MRERGRRSSPDLDVCLRFEICWSTQDHRFNLLIALCAGGNLSAFIICIFSTVNVHIKCEIFSSVHYICA